jgi:hypothetical protein
LKPYSLHASKDRDDPFVTVKELGLQEGIPAWIRIRVTNNGIFSQGKLSKYNFTHFNDETPFYIFSPCGTSIKFLLTSLTLSGLFRVKQR